MNVSVPTEVNYRITETTPGSGIGIGANGSFTNIFEYRLLECASHAHRPIAVSDMATHLGLPYWYFLELIQNMNHDERGLARQTLIAVVPVTQPNGPTVDGLVITTLGQRHLLSLRGLS